MEISCPFEPSTDTALRTTQFQEKRPQRQPTCQICTLFFHSNCFAKLLNRSSLRKAWYSSTVVSANCLQKHESVTASDFIGKGPLGSLLSAERYRWRGLMRCSKERLKYAGKLVTVCGPPLSSFTKYSYFGFKQFSIERDNTCTHITKF